VKFRFQRISAGDPRGRTSRADEPCGMAKCTVN